MLYVYSVNVNIWCQKKKRTRRALFKKWTFRTSFFSVKFWSKYYSSSCTNNPKIVQAIETVTKEGVYINELENEYCKTTIRAD